MNRTLKLSHLVLAAALLAACGTATPEPVSTTVATSAPTLAPVTPTSPPTQMSTRTPHLTPSPLPPTPSPSPTHTSRPLPMERLAFTVATKYGGMVNDTVIAFANSDGTGLEFPSLFEPFRETGGVSGNHLMWSPDGRYLAFDGADKIWECGGQTAGDCFATNYGTFIVDYSQGAIVEYVENTLTNTSWSPDSQSLVLSIKEKPSGGHLYGIGDLFVLNVKRGRKIQLTHHPSNDLYPAWSPDGQWIAFIRYTPKPPCGEMPTTGSFDECDNASLYLIRPDGSDLRLLLEPVHVEAPDWIDMPYNAPRWSPDSQWLAIMVESEGLPSLINQEIALVNIETGELRRLTDNLVWDIMPNWSPDGKRLAFVSGRDGSDDVFVMNIDGTNPVNLSHDPSLDYSPVWSPSGNYIAFISSRGTGHKLYVMNADGTGQTLIDDEYLTVISRPSWMPIMESPLPAASPTPQPDQVDETQEEQEFCYQDPRKALDDFLTYLSEGEYEKAARLYGSPYPFQGTQITPEALKPAERLAIVADFFQGLCEGYGTCLKHKIVDGEVLSDRSRFTDRIRALPEGDVWIFGVNLFYENGEIFESIPPFGVQGDRHTLIGFVVAKLDGCFKSIHEPPITP